MTPDTYHFADNRILDHASCVQISVDELDKKFGELIAARKLAIENKIMEQNND